MSIGLSVAAAFLAVGGITALWGWALFTELVPTWVAVLIVSVITLLGTWLGIDAVNAVTCQDYLRQGVYSASYCDGNIFVP